MVVLKKTKQETGEVIRKVGMVGRKKTRSIKAFPKGVKRKKKKF